MSVVRRFISIFVLASLPFATKASFAHSFPYDPSAPSFLKTPPTGTGFSTAARNQMFLTDNFEGYNIVGGFYGTYQESCPLGVLELRTSMHLTSICALGSSWSWNLRHLIVVYSGG